MVFQDRLVVVEDGQGRAGLDVEVVGGSCVELKLKWGFLHFHENARNFVFERKNLCISVFARIRKFRKNDKKNRKYKA